MGFDNTAVEINLRQTPTDLKAVWTYPLRAARSRGFTVYNSTGAPISNRLGLEIERYASSDGEIDGDSPPPGSDRVDFTQSPLPGTRNTRGSGLPL